MKILIAEDDLVSRALLERTLQLWGYGVKTAVDGKSALEALLAEEGPILAVLDWMMPEMDGVEVCRRIRAMESQQQPYLILLTSRDSREDITIGFDAGADDYVTKPFDRQELRSRIRAGERILSLQSALSERVQELEAALSQVKTLSGLLPVCCYCKRIRSDENYWQQLESYVLQHSDARFSHGICPDCWATKVEPQFTSHPDTRGNRE
jgi:sigma-B regulation protein RsbU (phosphoserine phosphatase)